MNSRTRRNLLGIGRFRFHRDSDEDQLRNLDTLSVHPLKRLDSEILCSEKRYQDFSCQVPKQNQVQDAFFEYFQVLKDSSHLLR